MSLELIHRITKRWENITDQSVGEAQRDIDTILAEIERLMRVYEATERDIHGIAKQAEVRYQLWCKANAECEQLRTALVLAVQQYAYDVPAEVDRIVARAKKVENV